MRVKIKRGARERPVVVFAGPSLPPVARPGDARFEWRPPAVAGDACALLADPPGALVLIDGLFDERPAIRHKELLELMAAGTAVIGGASMGALRAAELHTFGMVGVGRIFRAYASGAWDGDDEVALAHGPAEWDYAPFSEPLANVRATLAAAVRAHLFPAATARLLLGVAVSQFYKRRTWTGVVAAARARPSIPGELLDRFDRWLPTHRVDLKRLDALACLDAAGKLDATTVPPPAPPATPFSDELRRG